MFQISLNLLFLSPLPRSSSSLLFLLQEDSERFSRSSRLHTVCFLFLCFLNRFKLNPVLPAVCGFSGSGPEGFSEPARFWSCRFALHSCLMTMSGCRWEAAAASGSVPLSLSDFSAGSGSQNQTDLLSDRLVFHQLVSVLSSRIWTLWGRMVEGWDLVELWPSLIVCGWPSMFDPIWPSGSDSAVGGSVCQSDRAADSVRLFLTWTLRNVGQLGSGSDRSSSHVFIRKSFIISRSLRLQLQTNICTKKTSLKCYFSQILHWVRRRTSTRGGTGQSTWWHHGMTSEFSSLAECGRV